MRSCPTGRTCRGLKAPRKLRKDGAASITVRVIEYRLEDEHVEVTETFTLITTLLDPASAPARELAAAGGCGLGIVLRQQDVSRRQACRECGDHGRRPDEVVTHGYWRKPDIAPRAAARMRRLFNVLAGGS